jgi:transposase
MPRAHAQDVRDQVIDAVVHDGHSRRSAARRFGVSETAAIDWVRRYERAGDRRCAATRGHRPSKVKPERDWLLAVIAVEPHITLAALSARLFAERGVRADTSMLSRFFIGEGIRFRTYRATLRTGQP